MKCPYRKITENHFIYGTTIVSSTNEEFAECYGEECPFFKLDRKRKSIECLRAKIDIESAQPMLKEECECTEEEDNL